MLSKDIWMNLRLKSVLAFLLLMLSSYSNAILDSISVSDVLVTEGSIARALVTISPAAGENGQIILYEASAETAAGDDYFLASNRMVIEAGNTTGVIEVVIPVNDDAGVDLETFKLGVRADHILNSGFENGSAAFQVKEGVYNTVFRREINNPDPTYCVLGADVWVIKDWVCSYPYTFETNTVSAYGHVGTNSVHEIDAESQGFQNLVVTPGVEYEISLKATRRLHVDTPSTVDTTIEVVTQADFEVIAATTFTRSNTVWNLTEEKIIIPASNTEANIRLQFSTTNSTTTGMIIDDLSVVRVNPLGEGALASADAVATIGIIDASATAPQVLINSPHTTSAESFDVNFLFSEEINGFDLSDIQVSNGSVSNLISPELNLYQATVMPNPSPLESSEIVFTLLAGAVTSVSGGEENVTTSVTTIYDVIKPTVTVTPTEFNTLEANTITLNFSKPVAVLTLAEISVDNAVLSTFTKIDNSTYSVLLDPADSLIEAEQVTLLLGADAVSDAAGNMNDEVSIGIIFDQTPPVISVNGDSVVYSILGEQYNDAGASVIDLLDADIANKLVTVNSVDINAIADYSVTYDVTDAAGNVAVQKVRAVRVVVDPLITIKNYAADQSNSAPIISDFELIGIVGVSNENLLNINQKIASLTAIQVDSEDKIQVIVDQVIADLRSAAAIDVIKAFAESNINPAPTVTDYTTAEITGVTVSNIGAVNNAIDAITAAQADTANKIQAIVNQIVADLATAAAIDMIEAFADSNTNPVPAEGHYSAAGVAGVTSANIDAVNAAVEASSGVFADTTAKIQAIVSSVINSLKALAELIEDLNGNANSRLITANQLDEIHRVEGVIIANIDEYNAAFISAAFSDVNNPIAAEINAVIASVNTIVANETAALNELKEDIAGNANNDLVEASELNAIRGVSGAIQANQAEYQAEFTATSPSPFVDAVNPTASEIQAIIDSVNTIVANETAALNELKEDIAGNANNDLLEASELNAIRGVTGALQANQAEYQTSFTAISPSPFIDAANPTPAEIQVVIDSVNTIVANETAALDQLQDDIAGNSNSDLIDADELNSIRGVSGAIQANQAEYQAAFTTTSPSPFADPANPTPTEIQAIIDLANTIVANETAALNELQEDIAGNTNNDLVEASELNAIRGVSGALQANQAEYQAAFIATSPSPFTDPANPTPAEIQAVIDSVNSIVADENTAISELVEDLNGNANTNLITATQLEDIRGVTGVIAANIDEYSAAFVPAAFNDINNPMVAEIQAVINSVNTIIANETAALNELKEDIAGNTNNDLVEASELNSIRGVSGALQANPAEYQTAFTEASPSPFADPANPAASEIQAVIDSVNTIVANETAAMDELKEDIAGNANNDLVEASELNAIRGVTNAIKANQAEYQTAFIATSPSPFSDPANPTPAEIQAVINSVNTIVADETAALDQLKEDIAGNNNGDLIDADELNAIRDVSGAVQENQAEYQTAFTDTSPSPFADPANPTVAEINAVIASVNTIVANETAALNELKEDIAGNANNDLVEASELNAIRGVSGALQANQAEYQAAFIATSPGPFADTTNPTPAEIQAVIDSVNTIVANETAALNELKEDIAGNTNNDFVEASELNAIRDVSGAVQENQAEYQTAFIATSPSPFADTNNPTPAEIQAVIDSVNAIVADEAAALDQLKEDIAGNSNGDLIDADELNAIRDVSGAVQENQAEYQAAFTETSPNPFADPANPTPAEIQAVIDSVNTIVADETAALDQLKEDIAGNGNGDLIDADELNVIRDVSGAIQENQAEYQAAFTATSPSPFADPANPAPSEIQAVIDSVNIIVADETAALDQLKEDIAGNNNGDLIDADELNVIRDVSGAIQENQAEYQAAFIAISPSPFADTTNPTPAEIQVVIDSVNTIVADENTAISELVEDLNGNTNTNLITATQLEYIRGVTGVIAANIDEYNIAFVPAAFNDINNPTPAEIQAVIDSVNTIVADETAALDQLKEDMAGNSNGDLIDADELNAIRDISGAVQENQAEYQAAFTETSPSPFADTANPTASEIQAVIDSVNTIVANETAALDQLKEDIAGNSNGDLIDADELNAIRDVSGAVQENQAGYQDAFSASTPSPFADPTNPTAAEIQAIITAVNNGDVDSDNDGLPDSVDANDDNDDLTDEEEAGLTPATSTTDSCDPNTRHDNCDFDKDGVINGSDDDDDNDGVKDLDEVTEEDRSNVDSDGNGICDGAMAFAAVDSFKGCMPNTNPDSDADYDNDGTKDNAEFSGDTDGDLIPDYLDADGDGSAPSYGDSDKDGIDDKTECGPVLPCRDTDKDGVYDYLDTDSDNDGISDDEEADGVSGNGQDVTATDGSVKAKDTDTDGIPDYLDTDSDNDGKTDADENSPVGKDTDSDGIPDVVDHDDNNTQAGGGDSDNDGLSDAEECPNYPTNCPDSDNDGQPDYLDNNNDSDFDGIPDGDEDSNLDNDNNPATNPRDTDGDGVYDYLDTDSDNDGIDDADERSTPYDSNNLKDTDSDGIPDVIDSTNGDGDADSDGIPDSLECTGQPCRDTDNDGIPDFMDEDSDNDGLLDADEIGDINDLLKDTDGDGIPDVVDPSTGEVGQQGGDSDNDGVADAVECNSWPNCADSDNDGIADYLDEDSSPEVDVPNLAPELEKDLGRIKTGVHGAGSLHWGFALMLSLLVVLRRKSAVLMALPMLFVSLGANAEWWDEMDLYVGAGVGQSYLDPGLGGTAYEIDDHTKNAWKLTAGWDWNDHISIEGYYTELGTVDLKPGAHMTYRMMGGDAMLHFWAHGEERKKGSIALYAKAGLNHMTNNANGVNYDQGSNFQLFGGLGAELYLQRRFSVRLELESYDTDAALLSLNLIKRFGFKSKTRLKSEVLPKAEPQILDIVPVVVDSDLDGFLDDEDQCPYTPEGLTVDDRGCAEFDGKLGDLIASIQFEVNSASLTEASKTSLSEIVNMLKVYPAVKVDVQAHSDNTGSARYNKTLSQKRAESVVDYLRQKNITGSRLTAEGFGEERPVAENTTKDGRAKNRRVEFVLTRR
ncbi:MAG: outer membrane protein OmpA-like peptidoglycan-associated protein [Oleispira sp.]|jgi:outer membrane protein OmpA-like peptidoglycan-associated protein/uncharacterized protein YecA (UPF0149 family)